MKKKAIIFTLIVALLLSVFSTSCSKEKIQTESANVSSSVYPLTLTDQAGRTVTIEKEPKKIVSGYYISTSILMALGLEDKLVGIEAKADKRPIYRLSAPKLIDLKNVGSAKQFDLEGCISLEPDLVILPKKLKDTADTLDKLGIKVLIVDPEDIDRLSEAVVLIGDATNKSSEGNTLVNSILSISNELAEKTKSLSNPRVCITGNSSYLTVAPGKMYQNQMIKLAGGNNVASALEDKSWAEISYEQLLSWDPEYIILAGEADYSVEDILNDANLSTCSAVKNGNVYQFPSSAESLDSPVPAGILGSFWLTSVLHPEVVSYDDYLSAIKEFYKSYYGFDYSEN